ncbi:unnamed protein product [Vicia faba]|uniref:Uncharacterized protein n=1 Tax=Vicia faba TaxID=3906 RepID=A0AAV0Z9E9_VICFA|nr:unnamed protein product [Vicia faba]
MPPLYSLCSPETVTALDPTTTGMFRRGNTESTSTCSLHLRKHVVVSDSGCGGGFMPCILWFLLYVRVYRVFYIVACKGEIDEDEAWGLMMTRRCNSVHVLLMKIEAQKMMIIKKIDD